MEPNKSWEEIRATIPSPFYKIVRADKLEKEIRLSKPPMLKATTAFTPFTEEERHARELQELDERLQNERDFTEMKQKEFSKRWEIAYEKQIELDAIVQKFVPFYEGCQIKRERDKSRRQQYMREVEESERELRKGKKDLETLSRVKEETLNRKDLCERYKWYMIQVAEAYNLTPTLVQGEEPYKKEKDLLARFDELKKLRESQLEKTIYCLEQGVSSLNILEKEEKVEAMIEEEAYFVHRLKLIDYTKQLNVHVGGLNEKVIKLKEDRHKEYLEPAQPKYAIYALYCNLAKAMKQQIKIKRSDVPGQLRFIQKFLLELKKVPKRVREYLEECKDIEVESLISLQSALLDEQIDKLTISENSEGEKEENREELIS